MTLASDLPESTDFSGFSGGIGRQCGYRYLRYFCRYPIEVTICVTAKLCHFASELGAFPLAGSRVQRLLSEVADRRSRHVPETGRPSRKREDHHSRAVAAGDQDTEGN